MSYLSSPRIHFFGAFIAEPSTINNSGGNFGGPVVQPGWNPDGDHQFAFADTTVSALVDDSGVCTSGDPLIGGAVSTPGSPFAKLVDLDVEAQMVSRIFGLQVAITGSDGHGVTGTMTTASFRDFFGARLLGVYQSTLTELTWNVSGSSWLGKLKALSPTCLSIRFIVDLYTGMSPGGAHRGRLAGTIAPGIDGQPALYVPARRLIGTSGPSTLAQLDGSTLTVDAGNMLPVGANGDFSEPSLIVATKASTDIDTAIKTGQRPFAATVLPAGWTALGVVPTTLARYKITSGVESLLLSAEDAARAACTPLGLFTTNGTAVALEADDGLFVFPGRQALAIDPGCSDSLELTASRFGQPAGGVSITVVGNKNAGAPGLTFPASLTTAADGIVALPFQASDPGTPRPAIDGQVFGVGGPWADASDIQIIDVKSAIAIRVFSGFTPPPNPTWTQVQPVLAQYNKLYPAMKAIIDLDDPNAVAAAASEIRAALLLPVDDPGHMPVTRDLSEQKRRMIIEWIDAGSPV